MDSMELFDAVRAAVSRVKDKAAARDAAAVIAQDQKGRAEDAFRAACASADAVVAAAQAELDAAREAAAPLQAEIAAMFSALMPAVDPRFRQSR